MVKTTEREKDNFVTFILEMYKAHHNYTGWDTLQLFLKYGVIDYLKEFYTVISAEPLESIFDDIDEFIKVRQEK